jgi:hypothetical protein
MKVTESDLRVEERSGNQTYLRPSTIPILLMDTTLQQVRACRDRETS